MPPPKLLIATRNPGKFREYRQLLRGVPFELVSLDGLGIAEEVEETGSTFEENARLKAGGYASLSGLLTLADDSGLELDALGGEPGVHSARYGEKSPLTPLYERGGQGVPPIANMSDPDRVALLLHNLEGIPWERRTARFRCFLVVAAPRYSPAQKEGGEDILRQEQTWSELALLVGSVEGMIQYEPEGNEGFGYDPVFYLPSYGKTMAQLPLEEKNRISHRAGAALRAVAALQKIAAAYKPSGNS